MCKAFYQLPSDVHTFPSNVGELTVWQGPTPPALPLLQTLCLGLLLSTRAPHSGPVSVVFSGRNRTQLLPGGVNT